MAEYVRITRTNYVRVTDLDALTADLNTHGIDTGDWDNPGDLIIDTTIGDDGTATIALFPGYEWPTLDLEELEAQWRDDHPDADEMPVFATSVADIVVRYLHPDDILVVMSAGHEKLRYVGGYAYAVNAAGDSVSIDLDDIYAAAEKKFGITPSLALY